MSRFSSSNSRRIRIKASADRCFVQTAPNAFDTRRIAVLTVGFHRLVRCDDTHAVPVCRRLTAFFTDGLLHRVLRTLDNGQVSLRCIVTVTLPGALGLKWQFASKIVLSRPPDLQPLHASFASHNPGRRIIGMSPVRSTIVDSRPMPTSSPPSKIISIRRPCPLLHTAPASGSVCRTYWRSALQQIHPPRR